MTSRSWLFLDVEEQVGRLNRLLTGWANYFSVGTTQATYSHINCYTFNRLRQWYTAKHNERNRRQSRCTGRYAYDKLGLVRLQRRPRIDPCAEL
jgi:RNA-directed DNA polymerase